MATGGMWPFDDHISASVGVQSPSQSLEFICSRRMRPVVCVSISHEYSHISQSAGSGLNRIHEIGSDHCGRSANVGFWHRDLNP